MAQIEILLAPAGAGKTEAAIRRARAEGARALVVVPGGEQLRAMRARVQQALLGGRAPRAQTFDGLAALILRRAHPPRP
jgi:superfamily I DNA/RNA helicase